MINAQTHILRFVRCAAASAPLPLRWHLLYPFAIVGMVELVLLGSYIEFTAPVLSRVTVPAIAFLFGNEFVHYPQHIWNLPAALDWARFVGTVLVGFLIYPRAIRRLRAHLDTADTAPRPETAGGASSVFVAVALFAGVNVAVQRGVGLLADVPIVGRFQPVWLAGALFARSALVLAMAHTVYGITEGGRRGLGAVRFGTGERRHYEAVTVLIAMAGAILLAPLHALLAQTATLVEVGRPGLAETAATLAALWDIPVTLVLFASAVWQRVTRVAP